MLIMQTDRQEVLNKWKSRLSINDLSDNEIGDYYGTLDNIKVMIRPLIVNNKSEVDIENVNFFVTTNHDLNENQISLVLEGAKAYLPIVYRWLEDEKRIHNNIQIVNQLERESTIRKLTVEIPSKIEPDFLIGINALTRYILASEFYGKQV